MGSIVQLRRRNFVRRVPLKPAAEVEARQSTNSLIILISTFGVTALVMSIAVVVTASNTWTDVLVMSAFVFVFALAKIVMANALFYVMIKSDASVEQAIATKAKAGAVFRRPVPTPPRPRLNPSGARRHNLRKAGSAKLVSVSSRPRPSGR
jgi:hypothetical protein